MFFCVIFEACKHNISSSFSKFEAPFYHKEGGGLGTDCMCLLC